VRADLRLGLTALAATLALAVGGCGGGKGPIRIGVLADCVGFFGPYNDFILGAAELPLLERGARLAGPGPGDGVESATVAGRRVELLTGCTEGTFYTTLIAEVRRLVEREGADVIIGPTGQADGIVLRDYARRHPDVTFVLAASSAQEATLRDPAPNVFRFGADSAQWVAGLGGYAYHELGWRTAATVAENASGSWPQVAGFVAEFCALGGRVVDRLWTPAYSPDFSLLPPYAARVLKGVDGVALFPAFYQDTVGFAREYAKAHPDLPRHLVVGPAPFWGPATFRAGGRLLEGVVTDYTQPFESRSPAWLTYARGFREFFPGLAPQPAAPADDPIAIPYYDAMEAVLEALERAHGDLSHGERNLRAALSSVVLDSPNGRIRLDADRQAIAPAYLSRVELDRHGKPVVRTLRVVPNVEQTFGGLFNGHTPPPSSAAPACRRAQPPPWAK
jgi:branched-chain amino acid transport system substrate-binding protein